MNQAFNPATFLDVGNMSDAQVKALGQRDDIDHLPRRPVMSLERTRQLQEALTVAGDLKAAAKYYVANEQRSQFCRGKAETCRDIAAKLERFGSFASEAQAGYARKLIAWSLPRRELDMLRPDADVPAKAPAAPVAASKPAQAPVTPVVALPKLWDLMQRLSKLTIGSLTIARKNQDSLCWVKHAAAEGVIGKIENGTLVLFAGRMNGSGIDAAWVKAELLRIEADPQAAAVLHGKVSGSCSLCGRDITHPDSIALGVGPICAGRAGWAGA